METNYNELRILDAIKENKTSCPVPASIVPGEQFTPHYDDQLKYQVIKIWRRYDGEPMARVNYIRCGRFCFASDIAVDNLHRTL